MTEGSSLAKNYYDQFHRMLTNPEQGYPQIVKKLNEDFIKASQTTELVKRLQDNGTPLHTSTPQELARLLSAENERTKELVEALALTQK